MSSEDQDRSHAAEDGHSGGDHQSPSPFASHHGEGSHSEGEPWLVSYADMMTLLFGFFVLMYSIETAKKENVSDAVMERVRKELAEYFGGTYSNPLQEVEKYINTSLGLAAKKQSNDITVKSTPEGMKIVIRSAMLFAPGSSQLSPEAEKLVGQMAAVVKASGAAGAVRVEGHTDDDPIKTAQFPSNWDLSSSRAVAVLRIFESAGIPPSRLTAVGYGSSRPEVPNRDEAGFPIKENQTMNRRVVVNIVNNLTLSDPDKTPSETPFEEKK